MHGYNGFVLAWLVVGVGVEVSEKRKMARCEVHITDKMIHENCKLPILSFPLFICSFHYIFIISSGITFVYFEVFTRKNTLYGHYTEQGTLGKHTPNRESVHDFQFFYPLFLCSTSTFSSSIEGRIRL